MTDAAGNTTSFTYLPQAQGGFTFYPLAGIAYADGTSIGVTYDGNGNQLTTTGQKGAVTKYAYDTNGRPVSVTGPNQQTSTLHLERGQHHGVLDRRAGEQGNLRLRQHQANDLRG